MRSGQNQLLDEADILYVFVGFVPVVLYGYCVVLWGTVGYCMGTVSSCVHNIRHSDGVRVRVGAV